MDFAIMQLASGTSLTLVALGLALLLLSPIVERIIGSDVAGAAVAGGVIAEVIALVVSSPFIGVSQNALFSSTLSSTILLASGGARVMFKRKQINDKKNREKLKNMPLDINKASKEKEGKCVSVLKKGKDFYKAFDETSWRTYISGEISCIAGASSLKKEAWACGGVYYGIYFTTKEIEAKSELLIECMGDEGACSATYGIVGEPSRRRGCTSVAFTSQVDVEGNTVTAHITSGAALQAISTPAPVGGFPGAGSISFPDASEEVTFAVGSYVWECVRG